MYNLESFMKQVILVPRDHPDIIGFTELKKDEDEIIYVFSMKDGTVFRIDATATQVR